MDEGRLWRLFFATGLPEVYLALRGERGEREERKAMEPAVRTALRGTEGGTKKI